MEDKTENKSVFCLSRKVAKKLLLHGSILGTAIGLTAVSNSYHLLGEMSNWLVVVATYVVMIIEGKGR